MLISGIMNNPTSLCCQHLLSKLMNQGNIKRIGVIIKHTMEEYVHDSITYGVKHKINS